MIPLSLRQLFFDSSNTGTTTKKIPLLISRIDARKKWLCIVVSRTSTALIIQHILERHKHNQRMNKSRRRWKTGERKKWKWKSPKKIMKLIHRATTYGIISNCIIKLSLVYVHLLTATWTREPVHTVVLRSLYIWEERENKNSFVVVVSVSAQILMA